MPRIRKSTSLKFAAVAIGVAGIVGLTISSAASLNLSGGSVGAGVNVVASCQPTATGAITVSFSNTYSATTPAGYNVTSVSLGNVDAACVGEKLKVTLTGASSASLVELTLASAVAGTNTLTVPVGTTVLATAVVGTSVVLYN
jgi:hypothetical protein